MYAKTKEVNELFARLLMITAIAVTLFFTILGMLIITDNYTIYRNFIILVFCVLVGLFVFSLLGIAMILLSKPHKKTHPFILKWMKATLTFLYPFLYVVGCLIGIEKDRIRGGFAEINNYLVNKRKITVSGNEILLLAPHCIQWAECPYKITNNIKNCKMCGKCNVKDLIELTDKYGTGLAIVTGGTLARSTIVKKKPKAIVAIACERDLCSGIQDIKAIPVLGVVNERPQGPCYNTRVNIEKVEEAILYFLKGGEK